MSGRQSWRWLLLSDEDWPWVSRLPLWQYLLVDWAITVLAGLVAFAIAAAILRHFPAAGWLIAWIGTVTVVRPALEAGKTVISDRYTDSRYAYQAIMLEEKIPDPLGWLRAVHKGWTIIPDRTFLLLVPVEEALRRLPAGRGREHFEDGPFLEKVHRNYLALAETEPARFVTVDSLLPPEVIHQFVGEEIRRIARRPRSRRRR